MHEVVIVDVVRSPMAKGKPGGELATIHPAELLGQVILAALERTDLDPATVDDVLVGCVTQAGEQSGTVGRAAWLGAGLPVEVPAATIERKCGSGQQSVVFAAQAIAAGHADVVIAGGVEAMGRVPMGAGKIGQDGYGSAMRQRFPHLTSQGVASDRVAQLFGLTRDQLDEFSAASHHRAAAAAAGGLFDSEIVPVRTEHGLVEADSTIRRTTTPEGLSALQPVFGGPEVAARFSGLEPVTTAGSSSQITDGAAVAILMSAAKAEQLGLRPRGRLVCSAVRGDDPELMLTAPIPASRMVLQRAGLSADEVDWFEVNEAFATVPLAWMQQMGVEHARVNPHGGAIALGHPLGASGVRILATMLHGLEARGARYGLQTMCEAGGMANAYIVENLVTGSR